VAKQSGLGDNLYVAGYDLSGDIGSLGAIDGRLEFVSFFNPATDRAHPRLKLLPTADVLISYLRGTALGGQAACLIGKQANYDPSRGNDGSLTFAVQALANGYGLEWGVQLTAGKQTSNGAGNLAALNTSLGTLAFGYQAYLQVFSFTGTSATITIQHSTDDGSGDPYAAIDANADFTVVTAAPFTERIQSVSRTTPVEQWQRINLAGTYSSLVFAVIIVVNRTAVAF
jgi:hypothetical protein